MMNPVSLKGRGLTPIESMPAELLDYRLGFFGQNGFATIYAEEGTSFHGVLHNMAPE